MQRLPQSLFLRVLFSTIILNILGPVYTIELTDCPREAGKFLCKSGDTCIQASQVCDTKHDCLDASDEFPNCDTSCANVTCADSCMPNPDLSQSGSCYCKEGFIASGRKKDRCSDVDECDIFGSCSQTCENQNGSFQCGCISGFKLGDNNKTCTVTDANAKLVFAMKHSIKLFDLASKRYSTIAETLGQPVGITFDARRNYVYWTDAMDKKEAIYRGRINGSKTEIIVSNGLILPEGIAYDWIADNIYFTDGNKSHIGVCNSEGTICSIIIQEQMDKPRDIALHPNQGLMFWTDWGVSPSILRAGMDGSTPLAIIRSNLRWPNGIAVDQGNSRIYWIDANTDIIETSTLTGDDRQAVRVKGVKHPFGVDVFGDMVFWSDWTVETIQTCNKFTGSNHSVVLNESKELLNDLSIFHIANQPKQRTNHCENAKCSHICTLTPSKSYRCQCPAGMKLDQDRKTCKDDTSQGKLLFGYDNVLKTMYINSIGRNLLKSYTLNGIQMIGSAIYNPINGTVILSDVYTKKIYEYDLNERTLRVLVQRHIDAVKGIDIDVVGKNLYWADAMRRTVEVMSFKTGARFVILRETDRPMDLVVVPELKLMFVAQVGQSGGKITKLNMNGYNREVLIQIPNGEPVALTYHRESQNLFWCDSVQNTIEHATVDGRSYFVAVSKPGAPYGLASYRNQIFWSDRHTQVLSSSIVGYDITNPMVFLGSREQLRNGTLRSYTQGNFFAKVSVINSDISYADNLISKHECSNWEQNLNQSQPRCSHICLISGVDNVGTCVCPEGLQLDTDRKTCILQKTCFETQFTCNDGQCIAGMYKCDGASDCTSGEDELNCEVDKPCRSTEFKCQSDKICVPGHWKCDGENDCHDGSDESDCKLKPCAADTDFRCDSGRCIPQAWKCDHQVDCPDNSDEKGCNFTCPPEYFKCRDTAEVKCISADWVCDGESDCFDESDEHEHCDVDCGPDNFKCINHHCISKALVCNGLDECEDNSDESQCSDSPVSVRKGSVAVSSTQRGTTQRGTTQRGTTQQYSSTQGPIISPSNSLCSLDNYWCLSGECIHLNRTCDNVSDCMDGSDEGPDCSKYCKTSSECSGNCFKTPRGSVCSCPPGLQLAQDSKSCEDMDECILFNPCDHHCSNTKGSYKCTCHPAYTLKGDGRTCKASGKSPLFVYEWESRVYIAAQDMQSSTSFAAKPAALSGLDVDSYSGYVYWSNAVRGIVSRTNIDPKIPSETLFTGLSTPSLLTYDWISNNLFIVTHDMQGRESRRRLVIKVCSLRLDQNKTCAILYHLLGDEVTAMKVAAEHRYIFWTEISFSRYGSAMGAVKRGFIDGSEVQTLAMDKVYSPSGLAIDHVRERIMWIDKVTKVIESIDFDGMNRQIILPVGNSKTISGLVLFENWIMWTDEGKQIRCRVDLHSQCAHVTVQNVSDTMHITVLQQSLQPRAPNPCETNECGYICLPAASVGRSRSSKPYKCFCPENYNSLDSKHMKCAPRDSKPKIVVEEDYYAVEDEVVASKDFEVGTDKDTPGMTHHRHRIIASESATETTTSSSGASTAGIVMGILLLLAIIIVATGVVMHRRNIHPKVLVRPYVQQWVKYVNQPVQRFFGDNRPAHLDGEKHMYDEVYQGGGVTYSNPGGYEEIDSVHNLYTNSGKGDKKGKAFGDSGIMNCESSNLFEEDLDSHCITYSPHDNLIDKEYV